MHESLVLTLGLVAGVSAHATSDPEPGCYRLESRAFDRPVVAEGGHGRHYGLGEAYASSLESTFYLRPVDPYAPRFVLKDGRGDYLTGSGTSVAGKTSPSAASVLHLQPLSNGSWALVNDTGDRLRVRTDLFAGHRLSLAAAADQTTEFRLRPAETCRDPWVEDEPALGTDAAVPLGDPEAPIVGIADVHNHLFSNLGFNGDLISGDAHHPLGALGALDDCGEEHGLGGLLDVVGGFQRNDFDGHHTRGYPDASHPAHDDYTHQQSYYRWLERAHRGGLRLMVMLATSNRGACVLNRASPDYDCDDMAAVDRQIDAAYALVDYIDLYHGGPGQGWFQIAESPTEARALIARGKLAVVLGIETAELFGCIAGRGCTEHEVEAALDTYRDRGIRYLFPVHAFDNEFGGTALFQEFYLIGNALRNGVYPEATGCTEAGAPAGTFSREISVESALELLGTVLTGVPGGTNYPPADEGHCNARGLTDLGRSLVLGAAERGMMIDIDHMSYRMVDDVLDIAETHDFPLSASHAYLADLRTRSSERERTAAQMQRMVALGGFVAPITHQNNDVRPLPDVVAGIADPCRGSSEDWVTSMLYIRGLTGTFGVPLGSDVNGIARLAAPRFGPDRCDGASAPLTYPFVLPGHLVPDGAFEPLVNGSVVYDFNTDGLANIGLLPDFVADMQLMGLPADALGRLYNSAEAFVRMWESAERAAERLRPDDPLAPPPVPTDPADPAEASDPANTPREPTDSGCAAISSALILVPRRRRGPRPPG